MKFWTIEDKKVLQIEVVFRVVEDDGKDKHYLNTMFLVDYTKYQAIEMLEQAIEIVKRQKI